MMPSPTPRPSIELPDRRSQLDSGDTYPHSEGSLPGRVSGQSLTRGRENHSLACAQSTPQVDKGVHAPVTLSPLATRHGLPGPHDDSTSVMAYGRSSLVRMKEPPLEDQERHIRTCNKTTALIESDPPPPCATVIKTGTWWRQPPSHAVSGQKPPTSPEQPVFHSTICDFDEYSRSQLGDPDLASSYSDLEDFGCGSWKAPAPAITVSCPDIGDSPVSWRKPSEEYDGDWDPIDRNPILERGWV